MRAVAAKSKPKIIPISSTGILAWFQTIYFFAVAVPARDVRR